MTAPKPSPAAPPLAALETLFGPKAAGQGRPNGDGASSEPALDHAELTAGATDHAAQNAAPEPEVRSSQRVWDTVRDADRAQRGEARVTVTISVTVAQRRKLKQMALDQDTTIQKLLEPSVLAVLRNADRR